MKPELLELTDQDRVATMDEIRRAISSTQEDLMHLCHTQGDYCHIDSDFAGTVRYPAEEFEFFAYLSEVDENVVN